MLWFTKTDASMLAIDCRLPSQIENKVLKAEKSLKLKERIS